MATRPSTHEHRLAGLARGAAGSELPNIGHRLHDAVDLASGRIATTQVRGPLAAGERARRLADLGFATDLSVFGRPMYRLAALTPYQPAPEAWLDAFDGTYGAEPGVDRIWWRLPTSFPTEFMAGCNFSFRQLRAGPAVLSLDFEAWPHQGATGVVVVDVGAHRTEIEISVPVARTVDIGFVQDDADPLTTMVFFRAGLIDFRIPFNVAGENDHVWQYQPVAIGEERFQRASREDPAISVA